MFCILSDHSHRLLQNYNDWLTSSQEIERLERFCIAFKHYRAVQILETSAQDIQEQQDAIDRLRASIEELSEAQKEMQNRIDELITRQGEVRAVGGVCLPEK